MTSKVIWIPEELRDRLKEEKEHRRDTYGDVIVRALDKAKQSNGSIKV